MKDRVSTYPGRVRLTPVSGQTNVYDLERADQPTEAGTPLNKANLLTDVTAALLGGTSAMTPNEFLFALTTVVNDLSTDKLGGEVGRYTGTGSNAVLTFKYPPKAIIIIGKWTSGATTSFIGVGAWVDGLGVKWGGYDTNYGSFQESAFSCTVSGNQITVQNFMRNNEIYRYIVFF